MRNVPIEKPPYRPFGRYVSNYRQIHLFDDLEAAQRFAATWNERDSQTYIGWLAPTYADGKNRKPTAWEAKQQLSKTAEIIDHRS